MFLGTDCLVAGHVLTVIPGKPQNQKITSDNEYMTDLSISLVLFADARVSAHAFSLCLGWLRF